MKNKQVLFIILFFSVQTSLFAQISEKDFFDGIREIKKSMENTNYKYHGYFVISPLFNSDKEITFKDRSFVSVTLISSFNCAFDFDINSSQKVFSKSKNTFLKKQGIKIQTLTFITSYYHKIKFWAKVKNKCKNYKGNGQVLIHSEKVKL